MSATDRLGAALAAVRRTTPVFFLLRGCLWGITAAALLVAGPRPVVVSWWVVPLVLAALLPAALPRSAAVTLVLLGAVTGWIAATTVYGEQVSYLRLVLLAVLLYSTHVLAAISAVVPHDAVVGAGALLRWLPRTALLLVVTAVVALLGGALPQLFGGTRFLLASLVGLALTAVLAYYLARLVNRS